MKIPFLKESSSSNLPLITLFVLLITLVGLIFVGYEHFLGPENKELAKAEKLVLAEDEVLMEPPVSIITDSTSTVSSIDSSQGRDSVQKAELALEAQKQEAEAQKIPEEKVAEPSGSIKTSSSAKTNFSAFASSLFSGPKKCSYPTKTKPTSVINNTKSVINGKFELELSFKKGIFMCKIYKLSCVFFIRSSIF